jgi:hypothetical protein
LSHKPSVKVPQLIDWEEVDQKTPIQVTVAKARQEMWGHGKSEIKAFRANLEALKLPDEANFDDAKSKLFQYLQGPLSKLADVVHHNGEARCINFGKLPSWTYTNSAGHAIKTYWALRFKRSAQGTKDADCFVNLVKYFAQLEEEKVDNKRERMSYNLRETSVDGVDTTEDYADAGSTEDSADPYDDLDGFEDVAESQTIFFRNPFANDAD